MNSQSPALSKIFLEQKRIKFSHNKSSNQKQQANYNKIKKKQKLISQGL